MEEPTTPRKVIFYYADDSVREPFMKWLDDLRDSKGRRCIVMRIRKLEQGIYGDYKLLGEGVVELRIFRSPGYRIYFGEHENKVVILLGSDKDNQQESIKRAKIYWKDYKNREKLL